MSDSARNSATYEVRFTRQYANNTALKTIQADGETIAGFKPEQLDYSYVLPAGSTYPVISYEKADSVQSVVAGQVSEGEWNITVIAENDDKATYTVRYTISKYGDATLENLQLEGEYEGTFAFAATTYDYTGLTLGEGAPMPDMVITTKPGQKVLSYNVSDTQQKVLVLPHPDHPTLPQVPSSPEKSLSQTTASSAVFQHSQAPTSPQTTPFHSLTSFTIHWAPSPGGLCPQTMLC